MIMHSVKVVNGVQTSLLTFIIMATNSIRLRFSQSYTSRLLQ